MAVNSWQSVGIQMISVRSHVGPKAATLSMTAAPLIAGYGDAHVRHLHRYADHGFMSSRQFQQRGQKCRIRGICETPFRPMLAGCGGHLDRRWPSRLRPMCWPMPFFLPSSPLLLWCAFRQLWIWAFVRWCWGILTTASAATPVEATGCSGWFRALTVPASSKSLCRRLKTFPNRCRCWIDSWRWPLPWV